jgi:hypothetical protein
VIASLLPLFPEEPLQKQIELCKKLKLSNLDQQFVTFLRHAGELLHLSRPVELCEWAYFYANGFSTFCLQILGAHLEERKRAAFFRDHEERMAFLHQSIQRAKRHDPVVKSNHLLEVGIQPGVTMGLLLKEADRISINEQFHEPAQVIEFLQKSPLWPK